MKLNNKTTIILLLLIVNSQNRSPVVKGYQKDRYPHIKQSQLLPKNARFKRRCCPVGGR